MTSIIPGSSTSNRMFQGQRKDFIVMRKDTFEYTGTYNYVDSNGISAQYDFTDCIGRMAIKKKKTDKDPIKIIGVSFDVYKYILAVDADNMDIEAGKYYYDLQIYDANQKMVTKLYGNFIVLQDITDFEGVIKEIYTIELKNSVSKKDPFASRFLIGAVLGSKILAENIKNVWLTLPVNFTSFVGHTSTVVLRVMNGAYFKNIISVNNPIVQSLLQNQFSNTIAITTYKVTLFSTSFNSRITYN